MKIKIKNKKKLLVKVLVILAAIALIITTFMPFLSFII